MAKTNFQKRCEDCACLVINKGVWCCDECFGQPIENVDDCPEGATLEAIEEANAKAKQVKNVVSSAERKTERKPRERKVDEEKVDLIAKIHQFLVENGLENVKITKKEREIDFSIGENDYTLALTKHRKAKKQGFSLLFCAILRAPGRFFQKILKKRLTFAVFVI